MALGKDTKVTSTGDSEPVAGNEIDTEQIKAAAAKENQEISFDDAISLTKFGKFNVYLIVMCGIVISTALVEALAISYILPVSQCDMKWTSMQKGAITAVGFIGIISSSHLWGFLADTKGRRTVIVPTLLAAFACSVLSSVAPNFWVLAALRFLNGFFISGSSATVYAYLGEFHNNRQRSRAIMWASVVFGITTGVMPLLAWLVINRSWSLAIPLLGIDFTPWRLFIVVCGLPSLIAGLGLLPVPESPKFVLAQGRQSEAIHILQRLYQLNGGNGSDKQPLTIEGIVEERESIMIQVKTDPAGAAVESFGCLYVLRLMWDQTVPLFRRGALRITVLASVMQFCIFSNSSGVYMWLPEILNRMNSFMAENPGAKRLMCDIIASNANNNVAPLANETKQVNCMLQLEPSTYGHGFILEVLYIVGFTAIAVLINWSGKFPLIFIVTVCCGLCGIAATYVTTPLLAVYLFMLMLLVGIITPIVTAATVDLYATSSRGMGICLSMMMGRLGCVVGSNMVAILLEDYCDLTFFISGSILILCGFLAIFIPDIMKRRVREEPAAIV